MSGPRFNNFTVNLTFFKLGDKFEYNEEELEDIEYYEEEWAPETPKSKWAGPGHSKGGGWSPGTKVHAP